MTQTQGRWSSPGVVGLTVFAVALTLRVVYVWRFHDPQDFVFSDMWVYDHRARNLLAGAIDPWDTFTPIGYPALLAAVYALGGNALAVGVLQALLGAATAALASALALRAIARPALAWIVGLACATHLPSVLYSGLLLTETLSAFLIVSACWALAWTAERRSPRAALLGAATLGLSLGAGATVRPNLLLFMPFVPPLLWLASDRRWRRALPLLATVLAAFALPVGAAVAHNTRSLGRPASLATNGGLNFYLNLANVRGVRYHERRTTHRITPIPNLLSFPRDEHEEAVTRPFYDEAHYYSRGLALIRDDPTRVLSRGARNLAEAAGIGRQGYWPEPDTRLTRDHRRAFFIAALLPSLAGVLLAFARRRWASRDALPLLAATALVASALVTVIYFLGDPRMRVPFDPLLILLAAAGYLWLADELQTLWTRSLAWIARTRHPPEHRP